MINSIYGDRSCTKYIKREALETLLRKIHMVISVEIRGALMLCMCDIVWLNGNLHPNKRSFDDIHVMHVIHRNKRSFCTLFPPLSYIP